MIADNIAGKLECLNENTKKMKIKWHPIDEYLKYYDDNKELSEYIMMLKTDSRYKLYSDESFFIRKNDSYLVLISFFSSSNLYGQDMNFTELYGIFHKNAELVSIPQYFNKSSIDELKKNIKDYICRKEGLYSWETSEMIEFLDDIIV